MLFTLDKSLIYKIRVYLIKVYSNNDLDETNSNLSSLINRLGKYICIYYAGSNANRYVEFTNVKMYHRIPALFIGNANGTPDLRTCALFSDNMLSCSITNGTITATDNGDGTANIRIETVNSWGFYYLIVILK